MAFRSTHCSRPCGPVWVSGACPPPPCCSVGVASELVWYMTQVLHTVLSSALPPFWTGREGTCVCVFGGLRGRRVRRPGQAGALHCVSCAGAYWCGRWGQRNTTPAAATWPHIAHTDLHKRMARHRVWALAPTVSAVFTTFMRSGRCGMSACSGMVITPLRSTPIW